MGINKEKMMLLDQHFCERCGDPINDQTRAVLPIVSAPDETEDTEFCKECASCIEERGL